MNNKGMGIVEILIILIILFGLLILIKPYLVKIIIMVMNFWLKG